MDPRPGFTFETLNVIGVGDFVAIHFSFDGQIPDEVDEFMGLKVTQKHSQHDVMTWQQFNDVRSVRNIICFLSSNSLAYLRFFSYRHR